MRGVRPSVPMDLTVHCFFHKLNNRVMLRTAPFQLVQKALSEGEDLAKNSNFLPDVDIKTIFELEYSRPKMFIHRNGYRLVMQTFKHELLAIELSDDIDYHYRQSPNIFVEEIVSLAQFSEEIFNRSLLLGPRKISNLHSRQWELGKVAHKSLIAVRRDGIFSTQFKHFSDISNGKCHVFYPNDC